MKETEMAISFEQAMTADRFHEDGCSETVGPRGGRTIRVYEWRRNGKTQVWKTRPGEFRVPVKYGMRGYDYIDQYNADRFHVESDCPLRKEVSA